MSEFPFVSVVIPSLRFGPIFYKCLDSLYKQNYPKEKMEIIVVTVKPSKIKKIKKGYTIKIINGGKANPAEARNIAIKKARGSIIVFLDDDCVAHPNLIKNGVKYFKDPKVAAIGGPGFNPKDAPFLNKCSYLIFSSGFGTSTMSVRWSDSVKKARKATETDLVLCNMLVRKDVLLEINGFDGNQVPCEENELCHRIHKRGYDLLYTPDVIVWHPLRPLFIPLAKRIFFYATGRGVMSCRHPDSFKLFYAIPSIFVLGLILGPILQYYFQILRYPLLFALALYVVFNLYSSFSIYRREKDKRLLFVAPIGFFLGHASYGLGFIYGIFSYLTGRWKKGKLKT
jgi:cellulose synthase/poly-beta-1,6-N-acetylglucosamine synthase-like glycosyltransferase